MNKIHEKMVELVEELLKLSIDELYKVREEWLQALDEKKLSKEARYICAVLMDYVIEGKKGKHECKNQSILH